MLSLLLYLAKKSKLKEYKTSTAAIAEDNNFSQQTASRKLIELEEQGYINRIPSVDGVNISLTEKAVNELREVNLQLSTVLSNKPKNEIRGIVTTGLGEGKFYISIPQYREQLKNIFGFSPYQGTLNLIVDPSKRLVFLDSKKQHYIHGFKTKEREYGGLKAYLCAITNMHNKNKIIKNNKNRIFGAISPIMGGVLRSSLYGDFWNEKFRTKVRNFKHCEISHNKTIKSVVLVPDRTNHDASVIEVIAEKYLREELNLNDGDEICLI